MRTIWRFSMTQRTTTIVVPSTFKIRSVAMRGEYPSVWIEVDTEDKARTELVIAAFGTGEEIPEEFTKYIGTVSSRSGALWHHVYMSFRESQEFAPKDEGERLLLTPGEED